jgi:hypothetical protein
MKCSVTLNIIIARLTAHHAKDGNDLFITPEFPPPSRRAATRTTRRCDGMQAAGVASRSHSYALWDLLAGFLGMLDRRGSQDLGS